MFAKKKQVEIKNMKKIYELICSLIFISEYILFVIIAEI